MLRVLQTPKKIWGKKSKCRRAAFFNFNPESKPPGEDDLIFSDPHPGMFVEY